MYRDILQNVFKSRGFELTNIEPVTSGVLQRKVVTII